MGDAGFWLMLLLGGLLIYDGMLRTENLFGSLGDSRVVEDPARYRTFQTHLSRALSPAHSKVLGIPAAYLFAAVLVIPFGVHDLVGFIEGTDTHLLSGGDPLALQLLREMFNLVIAIVAFQFFILIRAFHVLVTEGFTTEEGPLRLRYDPTHEDGFGGFRDLGRFATRVNVILILGGLFLVYHIYVGGDPLNFTSIGALLGYTAASISWLYFGLWMIHERMQQSLHERRREARTQDPGGMQVKFKDAPVWPVSQAELRGIVSANLLPLLLALPRFLVPL